MSTHTQSPVTTFPVPPVPVRKFTVEEYHRMIQALILTEEDAVELLEGWIVPKMPRNPPHDAILDQAQEVLRNHLPQGWRLRVQSAITTDESEPEPDLVLVPGPANRYRSRHPEPKDVALLVEVADSTLWLDRTVKAKIYAQASIPYYWIINLVNSQIEVYSDPTGPDSQPQYQKRTDYGLADSVSLNLPGQTPVMISVKDLID